MPPKPEDVSDEEIESKICCYFMLLYVVKFCVIKIVSFVKNTCDVSFG